MIRLRSLLTENVKSADFISRLKQWENSVKDGWDSAKKKWFPHTSLEGGTPTIAYGHKLKTDSEYKDGITDEKAAELLVSDIDIAVNKIKNVLKISDFDSYPDSVQQALVNAMFRGELKANHETVKHIRNNQWSKVAAEYLNNDEYKTGDPGVKTRMAWNATQFREYAANIALTPISNEDITLTPTNISKPGRQVMILVNKDVLPIDSIILQMYNSSGRFIKKHQWFDVKQGILKFNAPSEPGVYILHLNKSASVKLVVK